MITIKEISQMLGMSTTTVSNVIHGKTKEVSPATVEKVEEILKKYEYVPNINARNLAQNESKIIGLAMKTRNDKYENFIKDPFNAEIVGGIEKALRHSGYFLMIYVSDDVTEIIRKVSSWNTDGLLMMGMLGDDGKKVRERYRKPMVFIDSYFDVELNNYVNIGLEDEKGAYKMTQYLINCGHRKIAFLADNKCGVDFVRQEGYQRALKDAGIPVHEEDLLLYRPGEDERKESIEEIYQKIKNYTAVFCASDYYAILLMNYLQEKGMHIPDDISIVGFDDNQLAQMHRPALTTVHQDVEQKGERAVSELLRMVKGKQPKRKYLLLPTELRIRDTVKMINTIKH